MAALGEMLWNELLAQRICLFLNRHWQFGVYPSKIQVAHIPTNSVREDSLLNTLARPGCVLWFNLICQVDGNESRLAFLWLSQRTEEDEGRWASVYLLRFHSVRGVAWVRGALCFLSTSMYGIFTKWKGKMFIFPVFHCLVLKPSLSSCF